MTPHKASTRPVLAAAVLAAAALAPALAGTVASAEDAGSAWQVARGDVRVVCPMTIGGSFEAKTGSLSGTLTLTASRPAAFSGTLSVDLRSLDSGIGLRNEHMRDNYLEVGKGSGYQQAVLSDIRLDGDAGSVQGRTGFSGRLQLHGTTRDVKGQAEVHSDGASVRVVASFPVSISDYGIPKPQYLGVGVRNEVEVKVSLVATPAAVPAGVR
ncbi:MAG TPA: YceI family protein [Vicinamibacteria bacterium]|nr:YceI family protein [Vicinamibacteria bacterium]